MGKSVVTVGVVVGMHLIRCFGSSSVAWLLASPRGLIVLDRVRLPYHDS